MKNIDEYSFNQGWHAFAKHLQGIIDTMEEKRRKFPKAASDKTTWNIIKTLIKDY